MSDTNENSPQDTEKPDLAGHQESLRGSEVSGKELDVGQQREQSDVEAQDEIILEPLPTGEENRDAALAGGIEGRPLHRVLSSIKSRPDSVNNISSIPNGGLKAWLQVAGSFVLMLNTWGIMNTFGVYQTYYETRNPPLASPSSISWIGSIQAFLLLFVGAFTGPVYDAGYFSELLIGGTFFVVLGHMMLSLCKVYYQVLLAQGFCIGIGQGLLFVPSVAILSTYFTTRLAFAVGIAATGSSLGGVIYPVTLYKLIPQVGFPWAVRTLGFIMLATFLVPNIVMRVRVLPASKRPLIDWSAFRQGSFMFFSVGCLLVFIGLYTPFFYGQYYAIQKHLANENLAFYLLAIMNTGSIFGRLIPNFIADYSGPINMLTPCVFICAILNFCMISAKSTAGIIVLEIFYGFFSGAVVSLPPAIVVHISPNRGLIGTRIGMCFLFACVGVLIGTPIAGTILDRHGWTAVWCYSGAFLMIGSFLVVGSRVSHKGWRLMEKA